MPHLHTRRAIAAWAAAVTATAGATALAATVILPQLFRGLV